MGAAGLLHGSNRTFMELKPLCQVYFSSRCDGSNRTFMELKQVDALRKSEHTFRSNRTFMELKLSFRI